MITLGYHLTLAFILSFELKIQMNQAAKELKIQMNQGGLNGSVAAWFIWILSWIQTPLNAYTRDEVQAVIVKIAAELCIAHKVFGKLPERDVSCNPRLVAARRTIDTVARLLGNWYGCKTS